MARSGNSSRVFDGEILRWWCWCTRSEYGARQVSSYCICNSDGLRNENRAFGWRFVDRFVTPPPPPPFYRQVLLFPLIVVTSIGTPLLSFITRAVEQNLLDLCAFVLLPVTRKQLLILSPKMKHVAITPFSDESASSTVKASNHQPQKKPSVSER